ncbi:MAG TPA: hypothetical protein VEW93_04260 [Acidimicrobiales bacterium]|nr:hypothetical protein [Acidimicrobiales bacterium]
MSPSPDLRSTIAAPGVDLGLTLTTVRMGVADPCWTSAAPGTWLWATRTPEGPGTVRLSPTVDGVRVEAWGEGAGWLVARAAGLVGALDAGPDPAVTAPAPVGGLLERFAALRLARTAQPLDAAIAAVCRRGVSAFEAGRSWSLMIEEWGDEAPGPGHLRLPPDPGRIAAASPYEMHVMGLEQERAAEVRRLASHHARLELSASTDGDATVVERLRDLPGVAPDVVDHVCAVALGDPDALPVVDAHVVAAVVRLLRAPGDAPEADLAAVLAPYGPQRGRVLRVIEAASAAV